MSHPAERLTVRAAEPPPQVIAGRYRLVRLLGRGGEKEVWLAQDDRLERPVALSRLAPGAAQTRERERVEREARITARLGESARVVTVYDVVDDGGDLLIVARFMAGGSLAQRLEAASGAGLTVAEVLRIGEEVADALAHVHEQGVVHRDVKPGNIWLAANGSASLGDFGTAIAPGADAAAGASLGTPYYVAPEQADGGHARPASDLYSLGATLYELLCGRPPFTGTTIPQVLAQHRERAPVPPATRVAGIPGALDALVLRLLDKDPARRPASAAEVRDALAAMRTSGSWSVGADPLIGRDRELALAADALRGALAGGLRTLVVTGEPGIGKTRLAAAVETAARTEGVLSARGRATDEATAFGPWAAVVDALARHGAALPGDVLADALHVTGRAAGGAPDRARVFDAVTELLAAAAAPAGLVLVLDDLHWADRSSLDLLRHVVRRAPADARLLLVVTLRDGAGADEPALAGALDDLGGVPGALRFALGGLALDDVRRFVAGGDAPLDEAVVRELHARTNGNPFFVAELAHSMRADTVAAEIPASVRDVVLRRLQALGAPTLQALDAAAVLNRPFSVATVARVVGLAPRDARAALEPARASRLVTEVPDAPGRLAFAHAIVRDVVHDALPAARRGTLHAAVVGVLREGDGEAAELAHHALIAAREGGDPQEALELALEAARDAEGLLAYAEAAGHYGSALEAIDELGADATPAERQAALERLAAATMDAGDVEQGRRHYRRAAAAARRQGDSGALARAALGFAEFKRYGETDHEGVDLLEQALAALPAGDHPLRVRVGALLGARLPDEATRRREEVVDEAVTMARRLGDDAALSSALWAAVLVNRRRERRGEQTAAAEEIVAIAPRTGDRNALLWARMTRLVIGLEQGDLGRVEAELGAVEALARESRRTYFRWCAVLLRATWTAFSGDLAEATRLADRALAIVREAGEDVDQEHTAQQVMIARLRDRPEAVDRPALRAFATRYAHLPVWSAMAADLDARLGRTDDALRSLQLAARDDLGAVTATRDGLFTCAVLAEPAALLGATALCRRLHDLLAPHAALNPVMDHGWATWGPVERPLGLLAAALGRPADAAAHLARAAALARGWGAAGWERLALDQLAEVRPLAPAERERAAVLADPAATAQSPNTTP